MSSDVSGRYVCLGVIAVLGSVVLLSYWKVVKEYKAVGKMIDGAKINRIVYRGFGSPETPATVVWKISTAATVISFLGALALLVIVNNVAALIVMAVFTLSALFWSLAIVDQLKAARPDPLQPNDTENKPGDYVAFSFVLAIVPDASFNYALPAVWTTALLSIAMLIVGIYGHQDSGHEVHRGWITAFLSVVCFHHVLIDGILWARVH